MPSARSFVAGLSVGIFFSVAPAQGFYNWGEFARWCLSKGGTPVPNPPRCFPPQSPPAQPAPPQEVTTFSQELSAYSDLVNRMNREDFGFLVNDLATPRNSNEMSARLLEVDRHSDIAVGFIDSRLDEAIYDRGHVQTIVGEVAETNKNVETIQPRNFHMENYIDAATSEYNILRSHAVGQMQLARSWLEYTRPRDLPYIRVPEADDLTDPAEVPRAQTYVDPPAMAADSHARPHVRRQILRVIQI
jgi:hypothetical protein